MLKCIKWTELTPLAKQQWLQRPIQKNDLDKQVQDIILKVRKEGDKALFELTQCWDKVSLSSLNLSTNNVERLCLEKDKLNAIKTAINTITRYHEATKPTNLTVETGQGIVIERLYRPIQRVGLYIPGGNKAPLLSSLLMQAIPAQIAGCPIRVLCTPPNEQGKVDPYLQFTAWACGIESIYLIGGAQAIAAMAYGTESVPKVDKLFGPGNAYVTQAKQQVAFDPDGAAIDMPAGPSEVMILADESANPNWIAADLLAQAEHGCDSQVFLLCDSKKMADQVNSALNAQLAQLTRQNIAAQSLRYGCIFIVETIEEQLDIVNFYAPEHLIINRKDAANLVDGVKAAGTVFLGAWAAETMGDYITGSNHVLPTAGFARKFSGLSVTDFLTAMTVQTVSEIGVREFGQAAERLAEIEGLDGHAKAIRLRLNALE